MLLKELEPGVLAEALPFPRAVLDSVDAGHLSQAARVTAVSPAHCPEAQLCRQ